MFILRNNLKKQLRKLSKHFIIVIIFETNDAGHKSFINHIIKQNMQVDAAFYFENKEEDSPFTSYLIDYQ